MHEMIEYLLGILSEDRAGPILTTSGCIVGILSLVTTILADWQEIIDNLGGFFKMA